MVVTALSLGLVSSCSFTPKRRFFFFFGFYHRKPNRDFFDCVRIIVIANGHLINALTVQYGRTLAACKASQESNGSSMDIDGTETEFEFTHVDSELKDQLYDLADVALQANSDRLAYLEK